MYEDCPRTRAAREAAERALVRVVHHDGARPGFVVLGGLVPEVLCSGSKLRHAGTTDVDVQVNLEIDAGAVNAWRLEIALRSVGFEPERGSVWRWITTVPTGPQVVVKFELLADLDDQPSESTARFVECEQLGAVNLRGTGFAARDYEVHELRSHIDGAERVVQVNMAGLAGFLLAKVVAARWRRKRKDWYDIAFVLLHNDAGGPSAAAFQVLDRFEEDLGGIRTALDDLSANFASPEAQGPGAYVEQMVIDHPDLDAEVVAADAVVAVGQFLSRLSSVDR
jgi:hypothetical protein